MIEIANVAMKDVEKEMVWFYGKSLSFRIPSQQGKCYNVLL